MEIIGNIQWEIPQEKLPRNSYAVDPLIRKRDNLAQLDSEIKTTQDPAARAILNEELKKEMGAEVPKKSSAGSSIIGEIQWEKPKKEFSLGKELSGMATGVADIAAGLINLPISGIVGLGTLAATGDPTSAEKAVSKTQEMLTPSVALEKMGIPKDYTSESGTHDLLMKIISAPHDYISKPIADAYFKISGKPLPAAILQGILDIPTYMLAFKAAGKAMEATARTPDINKARENLGYVKEKLPEINEAANKGYTDSLNFGEEKLPTRPPYNLLPKDEIARLEAELNPAVEQRVPGQGELFTQERPYQPNELIQGSPPALTEAARGNRDRIPDPRTDVTADTPFRAEIDGKTYDMGRLTYEGEKTERRGYPYEQEGIPFKEPTQETIQSEYTRHVQDPSETHSAGRWMDTPESLSPVAKGRGEALPWMDTYDPLAGQKTPRDLPPVSTALPLTERGSVGEARARVAEQNQTRNIRESSESVPYQGQGSLFRGPGGRQRGAIDLRGLFRRKGPAKATLDQRGLYTPEERSAKEVAQEMAEKNLHEKDISYGAGLGGNFAIPQQMAYLTQNKIVKWATDKTSAIENKTTNLVRSLLEGDRYVPKKNGELKRVPDETVGIVPFRKYFKENPSALSNMKDVWLKNQNKAPLTRESFKSEVEWRTFSAMKKSLDFIREKVNEARRAANLPEIPYIENYFPSSWRGDYYISVKAKDGASFEKHASWNKYQAKKIAEELQKKFPDHEVTWDHYEKSRYDINDTSAFERAAKILENEGNRKLAEAMDRIASDVIAHKGAMKRGLKKQGTGGYLGSESGKKGLQNLETAYTDYLNIMARYLGNIEKAKLKAELMELPAEFKQRQKEAINFSEQLIDRASGKKLQGFDIGAEAFGRLIGIGASGIPKAIQGTSAVVAPMLLITPRQILANALQPIGNISRLERLKQTGEVIKNPWTSFFEGYSNWLKPDPTGIKAINWASKEGWLDPTITAMLDMKISEAPSGFSRTTMELLKLPLSRVEQVAVRGPSFMMYEKALRDTIKDDITRFKTASKVMDDAMVNYHPSNSPFIYNRMGVVGEALKPLKQYEHNAFGQFLDYVAFAKNTGKLSPLAWHLSNTLLMGGLKNAPLMGAAVALVSLYNLYAEDNLKDPRAAIEDAPWIPDALVQGIPSTLLGYDISSSIGGAQGNSWLSAPGIEITGKAVWNSGKYIAKYLQGTDTDWDAMNAWLSITPNGPLHNWIEEAFTDDTGFMLNRSGGKVPYQRNMEEKAIGAITGLRSTQNRGLLEHTMGGFLDHFKVFVDEEKYKLQGEAQARSMISAARNLLKQDNVVRQNLFELMKNKAMKGQDIPDFVREEWAKLGGDPKTLSQSLRESIQKDYRTPIENAAKGNITPNKAHRLERMEGPSSIPLRAEDRLPRKGEKLEEDPEEGVRPISQESKTKSREKYIDRMPRIVPKNLARDIMPRANLMVDKGSTKDWRGYDRGETRI